MRFQKVLTTAMVSALLASSAEGVLAEVIPVEISGQNVSVTIRNPEKNKIFSVITKDGAVVTDDNLFGICETDGTEVVFKMPDFRSDIDGEYTLYVQGEKTGNFYYAKESGRVSAQNALDTADANTLKQMLLPESEYYYSLRALGFDVDAYEALTSKDDVLNMFVQRDKDSSADVKEQFNKAVSAEQINKGDDANTVLEKLNPTVGEKEYSELSADLQKWIMNDIKANAPYASIEEFESEIERAEILYRIDNAKFSQIKALLAQYENELGITSDSNYIRYKALPEASQTAVHDYMVVAFGNTDCTSVDILKNTLASAVSSVNVVIPSGSSGGSGGSGSSGGKSSGNAIVPVTAPTTNEKPKEIGFNDLDKAAWAKEAVLALAEKGIVAGDGSGAFNPNDNVTREQFVKMIVSAMEIEVKSGNNVFDDVNTDSWYADYVLSAYNEGIVFGVNDTVFGIGNLIKRQDMAVIAYRALKGKELESTRDAAKFADEELIKDYAKEAIDKLYKAGVINGMGDNCFNPDATATRAESAMIIYNLFVK